MINTIRGENVIAHKTFARVSLSPLSASIVFEQARIIKPIIPHNADKKNQLTGLRFLRSANTADAMPAPSPKIKNNNSSII